MAALNRLTKRRLPLLDAINLKKDGNVNINLLYFEHNLYAIFINQAEHPHTLTVIQKNLKLSKTYSWKYHRKTNRSLPS